MARGCRVTFCADDLGASPGVNDGILQACDEGPIRRLSVLAVGHALEAAARAVADRPGKLQVGLHLSLTAGRPLTSGGRRLAGADGVFPSPGRLLCLGLLGRLHATGLREELEAQWARLEGAGLHPTFLDGHHHAHLFPGVAPVVAAFAREHGVGRIRLLGETWNMKPRRRQAERALLLLLSRRTRRHMLAAGLDPGPERSAGLGLWRAPDPGASLRGLLESLPAGPWEVFLHPRRSDPIFATLDRAAARGRDPGPTELALLTDPAFHSWLEEAGFWPGEGDR